MVHNLSFNDLQVYEALIKCGEARIEFKCDEVTYQGIIDVILPDARQVRLRHSKIVEEDAYLGNLRFRFFEISSFRVVESAENVNRIPKNEYLLNILKNNLPVQNDTICKALYDDKLSDDEDEDANEQELEEPLVLDVPKHLECKLSKDYTLIENLNEVFYQAIQCISGQQVIGVSMAGPEISRIGKLTWICISTEVCLFLFDIQQLKNKAFDNGLRNIFESKSIKKVIHDCKMPSDCLAHLYATCLTNVFDTRVADFVVNEQRHNDEFEFHAWSSLDCCLRNYLHIPQEFLFNREVYQSSSNQDTFFSKRPISNAYLYDLIKSALYLKLLQEELLKELFAPLYSASDFYRTVLAKASREVRDFLGSDLSKPDTIPPGLLMHRIQTVRFLTPPKFPEKILVCEFIDPRTGKKVETEETSHSPVANDENKINVSSMFMEEKENEISKQKDPLINNASLKISSNSEESAFEEVDSIFNKPSFRQINEVYYKLVDKMYPNQSGNVFNVKPPNYISTCPIKRPSSFENVSHETEDSDLNASCSISGSNSQLQKESDDIWSKLRSEAAEFPSASYTKRKVRYVPG